MNTQRTFRLSQEAIDEFKAIAKAEGIEIGSDAEAEEMALRLLRLFDLLTSPNTEETAK